MVRVKKLHISQSIIIKVSQMIDNNNNRYKNIKYKIFYNIHWTSNFNFVT